MGALGKMDEMELELSALPIIVKKERRLLWDEEVGAGRGAVS
jgi:hypothetical protein